MGGVGERQEYKGLCLSEQGQRGQCRLFPAIAQFVLNSLCHQGWEKHVGDGMTLSSSSHLYINPQQAKPSLLPTFSGSTHHPFSCVAHAKSQRMREHLVLIYSQFLQCHFLTELPLLARTLYVIRNRVLDTCPHPTASPSWAPAGRYGWKSGLLQHLCLGCPIENVFLNIAH